VSKSLWLVLNCLSTLCFFMFAETVAWHNKHRRFPLTLMKQNCSFHSLLKFFFLKQVYWTPGNIDIWYVLFQTPHKGNRVLLLAWGRNFTPNTRPSSYLYKDTKRMEGLLWSAHHLFVVLLSKTHFSCFCIPSSSYARIWVHWPVLRQLSRQLVMFVLFSALE
jgi:hypothetical protein